MYKRFAECLAKEVLSDTPVVLIVGPRRVGKTTLARKMEDGGRGGGSLYPWVDMNTVMPRHKRLRPLHERAAVGRLPAGLVTGIRMIKPVDGGR